jgi:anti-sigma-K factor RsiG
MARGSDDRSTVPASDAPGRPSGRAVEGTRAPRPSARPIPERNSAFDHLPLEKLRAYRAALGEEENRVSYWRRILHARIDIIHAGTAVQPADVDSLRAVLARSSGVSTRTALLSIVPADKLPSLPDLSNLWDRDPIPGDDAGTDALATELARVERQLSAYRTALHERIGAATVELIARYREEPTLCLSVLPEQRDQRSSLAI